MDQMITMTRNRPRYDEQMFLRYPPGEIITSSLNYKINTFLSTSSIFLFSLSIWISPSWTSASERTDNSTIANFLWFTWRLWSKGIHEPVRSQMAMMVVNRQCIPDSAERYRNRVLERQLQDMARSHAREKQGLMTKLEDLK